MYNFPPILEVIAYLVAILVLPVVINKSTENGKLDWIKPYLRHIWAAIFAFYSLYILQKSEITEVVMKWHPQLSGLRGYFVAAIFGALLMCCYWWFAVKAFTSKQNPIKEISPVESSSFPKENPKPLTAEEIKKAISEAMSKTDTPKHNIIQVLPSGNIKERAISLSKDIKQDLWIHGWWVKGGKEPQVDKTDRLQDISHPSWIDSRSRFFEHRFLNEVLSLRDELSQLHLKDERLERLYLSLERRRKYQKSNAPSENIFHSAWEIEGIADALADLGNKTKD